MCVGDIQKDTPNQQNKKNSDDNLNLQEIENKSVTGMVVSRDVSPISPISPTSPTSPRTVEEEENIKQEVASGYGASVIETMQPDFNYGDFSCPQCERLFPNATNRQMHLENEHLRRPHKSYRSGSRWYCKNCKETGDKFEMQETTCSGIKKK